MIPPLPAHFRVMRLEDADWEEIDHNARPLSVAVRNGVGVHYLLTVERPEDAKSNWPYMKHSSKAVPPRPNVSLALHCHTPPTLEQIEAMQRLSGLCHSLWLAGSPRQATTLACHCGGGLMPVPDKLGKPLAVVCEQCARGWPFAGLLLLPEEWEERSRIPINQFWPKAHTDESHLLDLYEQAQACGLECYLGGEA